MPPVITSRVHERIGAGALIHDHIANRGTFGQRFIHRGFELHFFPAPVSAVRGDDDGGAQIVDASLQCFGGKSTEHDAVNDAEPGAGEHGDGEFRNHRHVQDGPVAGFVAARLEHGREADHQPVQFLVGEHALFPRLTFPDDGGFIFARRRQVTIQAVIGDVGLASGEPFGERRIPFEHARPGFEPVDVLCGEVGPELCRIFLSAAIQVAIFIERLDARFRGKLCRRGIHCGAHRNGFYQSDTASRL